MNTQSDRGWTAVLVAAILVTLAAAQVSLAQRTLVNFDGTNGDLPFASLVQGLDGNLYGTTYYGGANGYGAVYKMTPAGTMTTVYSFCAQTNCADGSYPDAGLVPGTNGNFYGTTVMGGAYNWGTVFKITPTGELATLYSFCSQGSPCADGAEPDAELIQATDGNFYGTTPGGGTNSFGTVFKITPAGKLTTLYSFCARTNCTDGREPYAGLIQAADGNCYGTTGRGGASGTSFTASGTVFKITPDGVLTTFYSFAPRRIARMVPGPMPA